MAMYDECSQQLSVNAWYFHESRLRLHRTFVITFHYWHHCQICQEQPECNSKPNTNVRTKNQTKHSKCLSLAVGQHFFIKSSGAQRRSVKSLLSLGLCVLAHLLVFRFLSTIRNMKRVIYFRAFSTFVALNSFTARHPLTSPPHF